MSNKPKWENRIDISISQGVLDLKATLNAEGIDKLAKQLPILREILQGDETEKPPAERRA